MKTDWGKEFEKEFNKNGGEVDPAYGKKQTGSDQLVADTAMAIKTATTLICKQIDRVIDRWDATNDILDDIRKGNND